MWSVIFCNQRDALATREKKGKEVREEKREGREEEIIAAFARKTEKIS